MRIGLRILLGYLAIVALGALLVTEVFVAQVKPGVRQTTEDTLVDIANTLAELATDDFLAGRLGEGDFARRLQRAQGREPGAAISGVPKRSTDLRVYVTDDAGTVVFDSRGEALGQDYSQWNDVYLTLRGHYGARSSAPDPADPEATVMHVAAPIRDPAGRIVGSLTVAKPNRTVAPFIERSQRTVLAWGIGLLGMALLVGATTASWITRQLEGLRRYAQSATDGERRRLPPAAGEFAELGQALETMRNRLEGKQYVERYVQDLTHEMKSPLAAIRASAELLESPLPPADQARFARVIHAQGDRLTQMVERLLALAALEHQHALDNPAPVPVGPLLAEVAADFEAIALARGLSLQHHASDNLVVTGDAFLLHQALRGLLENAASFAPAGSALDLLARRDNGHVVLEVADRGPGLPDYALERAFERFYSLPRPDGGQRGSGLGLCFVAEVAALHGGSARLVNREGGGAVAGLRLPAASGTPASKPLR
ncbi:two-component sensor histidine kinase [Arenimonas soli]|uniref:histidine kinase n=1 Tax=Arenimonas soli TaxID=2269504 RepID=A0ABQ1HH89_9GAMM|nr:two-component system sensor histidine kinase CreC [Arenimonas soli]GGA77687.1 two-component sensor histidine kinase [Arenimonas soli]